MGPPGPLNPAERLVPMLAHRWRGRFAVRALRLLYGIDFPRSVSVGRRLRMPHCAFGLVLDGNTVIGDDVTILHGVTVGIADLHLRQQQHHPVRVIIGDRALISAGAAILCRHGETLRIGQDAIIGANAVVRTDVPPGEIWGGVPARFLSRNPNA